MSASSALAQQGVFFGNMGDNDAVCTGVNGQFQTQAGSCAGALTGTSDGNIVAHSGSGSVYININPNTLTTEGGSIYADNNIHANNTVSGGTLTDGTAVITGGNISSVKNITGDGTGSISNFASISGGVGNFGTVNATTGNIDTVNAFTVNATTGNITTVNASTVNAATVNATTGNIDTVNASTVNATTGNITTVNAATVNATDVNATTVNSTTITNTGKITTATLETTGHAKLNSVEVTNNATVGGNLSVTGVSNLTGGLTVGPGTNVSMGGNVVHNVAAPIVDTDAANKGYVDAGLAKAFKEIDRNTQGIAIAMAMGGLALPDTKTFAIGANLGFFDSKQAIAVQGALRLTPFVSVSGGVGVGLDGDGTIGGRVGAQVAW